MTHLASEPPAVRCPCRACVGMRKMYGKDPVLLAYYGSKLLTRAWARGLDGVEKAYVLAHSPRAAAASQRMKAQQVQGVGHRFGKG